jgi:peptide-methionine (R)-S-oxide reductase
MKRITIIILSLLTIVLNGCSQSPVKKGSSEDSSLYPDAKPNSYWKRMLSPDAYEILVNKGTETPYKNPYWDNHRKGIYVSAATGKPLFSSTTKFDSGTGWPSFYAPIDPKAIRIVGDHSDGMVRDEVVEASTGLHLGHVFDDGPAPTGKRYCMDSYALKFIPAK